MTELVNIAMFEIVCPVFVSNCNIQKNTLSAHDGDHDINFLASSLNFFFVIETSDMFWSYKVQLGNKFFHSGPRKSSSPWKLRPLFLCWVSLESWNYIVGSHDPTLRVNLQTPN